MRDVAALAGVSLSTVSRAVRGDSKVDPDLAKRVDEAVEMTGYRRDFTASTLRRANRRSATVGLIVEDVANPFFAAVYRGIEDVVRGREVLTVAGSSDADPQREQGLAQAFMERRVDGLLMAPTGGDYHYLVRERAAGLPLVFVDRPPGTIDADVVVSDNLGGGRTATEHLLAAGHRRIAFLGDRLSLSTAAERLTGYIEALGAANLPYEEKIVRDGLRSSAESERATLELLRQERAPTAVFAAQNQIALGAMRALRRLDLQRSVGLVGFDDVEAADLVSPGLTVVAQEPYELGRAAARVLFSRLDGDTSAYRRVSLRTRLIKRGSGEIAPASGGG